MQKKKKSWNSWGEFCGRLFTSNRKCRNRLWQTFLSIPCTSNGRIECDQIVNDAYFRSSSNRPWKLHGTRWFNDAVRVECERDPRFGTHTILAVTSRPCFAFPRLLRPGRRIRGAWFLPTVALSVSSCALERPLHLDCRFTADSLTNGKLVSSILLSPRPRLLPLDSNSVCSFVCFPLLS